MATIKALACERPHEHGLPLSRLSVPEIRREGPQRGLVASIGETTVWRWLAEMAERWPTLIVLHTPVHTSWLNQAEVYFSVVQRKALTPNDFQSLAELEAGKQDLPMSA